jgi:hypothetical protein
MDFFIVRGCTEKEVAELYKKPVVLSTQVLLSH